MATYRQLTAQLEKTSAENRQGTRKGDHGRDCRYQGEDRGIRHHAGRVGVQKRQGGGEAEARAAAEVPQSEDGRDLERPRPRAGVARQESQPFPDQGLIPKNLTFWRLERRCERQDCRSHRFVFGSGVMRSTVFHGGPAISRRSGLCVDSAIKPMRSGGCRALRPSIRTWRNDPNVSRRLIHSERRLRFCRGSLAISPKLDTQSRIASP